MNQVTATLNRAVQVAQNVSTLPISMQPIARPRDNMVRGEDDLLDDWLATVSEDEFERLLSRLAELR